MSTDTTEESRGIKRGASDTQEGVASKVANTAETKMSIEAKLAELGVTLPPAAPPQFTYVPTVLTGNLLYVSGQVSKELDGKLVTGKVGRDLNTEEAQKAARLCVIHGLSVIKQALGSLDNVARVVKVVGFVASAENFTEQPKVINGASDFLVSVFGEAGRHARSAIGVFELPLGVAVEVEFILEVTPEFLAKK
eukprot:Phypoly_transcript_20074.p1 GENE.Phypoly_transcript_20074~~Phypoly_transcript_20074.p1  ORF type:complete len:220 (+),score=44.90 Phypoly_transcript_20074:79-660(+)